MKYTLIDNIIIFIKYTIVKNTFCDKIIIKGRLLKKSTDISISNNISLILNQ